MVPSEELLPLCSSWGVEYCRFQLLPVFQYGACTVPTTPGLACSNTFLHSNVPFPYTEDGTDPLATCTL